MPQDIGIDVSKVNDHFNEMFDATITRIRRCFIVKSAALERIQSNDTKMQASGYYHLNKILDFQLRVYGRYLEQFGKVRLPADAQDKLAQLEELDKGIVKGLFFRRHKRKLQDSII